MSATDPSSPTTLKTAHQRLAPQGRGRRRSRQVRGAMLPKAEMMRHGTPHPSFAKSLSLLALLPSPLRGEEAHEPITLELSILSPPPNHAPYSPHHSGLTGGAAATGGRGDAVRMRRCIQRFETGRCPASDGPARATGKFQKSAAPRRCRLTKKIIIRGGHRLGARSYP